MADDGVTNPAFDADEAAAKNGTKERKSEPVTEPSKSQDEKPKVITAAGASQVESGYRRVEPSAPVEKKSKRVHCVGIVCILILLLIVAIVLLAVFLTRDSSSSSATSTPSPQPSAGDSGS